MYIQNLYRRYVVILFALVCLLSTNAKAQNVDIDILKSINPRNPTSGYWSATSSSVYWVSGGAVVGTLAYGFIKNDKNAQYNAYEMLVALGISTAVSEALKVSIDRTRPADEYPNDVFVTRPIHGKAFPSGHTTLAFTTATTLSLEYKKWYIVVPAYLWAGSVGYSRMYKGYHAPSDILGGIAVGVGSGYLSHWLSRKIFKPIEKPKQNITLN
jgi:membrane-associated phospholipid phosphatase